MGEEQKTSYTIAESEAVEAAKFTALKRLFSRPLLPIFIVLLVIFAILAIYNGRNEWMVIALAFALAAPLAFFVVLQWMVPWQAKRHFRQAVALRDEISLKWGDKGIELSSAHGSSRLSWNEFQGWAETGQLLILYQSELFYNIVPKRALTDDSVQAIKRRLDEEKIPAL